MATNAQTSGNVSNVELEGVPSYVIFFDDQSVRQFVTNWTTSVSCDGQPGQASITMLYSESLANFDYLTDVKIFVKNIFSGRHRLVFDGQIHGRTVSVNTAGQKSITYTALDNMFWFARAPLPVMLGVDKSIDHLVMLTWLSKGVNYQKIKSVLTKGQTAFENLNIQGVIDAIFKTVNDAVNIHADAAAADKNSIYNWINLSDKIRVISDIDKNIRSSGIIDIAYQGSILDNIYVFLNDLMSKLGFEFYQDIDSIIKIKEPYWNEGILKNFVIDPILITNMDESTNWDSQYSRVLVSGGVDALYQNSISDTVDLDNMTPAGVFVGSYPEFSKATDGIFVSSDDIFGTGETSAEPQQYIKGDQVPFVADGSSRANIINAAQRAVDMGVRYSHGGRALVSRPPGLDCSGLVYWAYNQAGITVPYRNCADIVRTCSDRKISVGELQPGDIGVKFKGYNSSENHTGIYAGSETSQGVTKYMWIQASSTKGKVIRSYTSNKGYIWNSYYNYSGAATGGAVGGTISAPVGAAFKTLTNLTDLERRFGVSVFETNQPLIKLGMESKTGTKPYAYLKKYSSYLYNVLNAGATTASINLVGAPWLRPGFNVWLDPLGMSRIYYISSVRHYGDSSGTFTSLGLTYGRSEQEYIRNYKRLDHNTPVNPFTKANAIGESLYFNGADPLAVVTPDNMGEKKYVKNSTDDIYGNYDEPDQVGSVRNKLREYQVQSRTGVPIQAYESLYAQFYGQNFVRGNSNAELTYLNRWDSEFNYVEIKAIIAAGYKLNTDTVTKALELPFTGPLNPSVGTLRSVSHLARAAIIYDRDKLYTPAVITERASKTAALVKKALTELHGRYTSDFEYTE